MAFAGAGRIDQLIARLRELSLAQPAAVLSACPPGERDDLALAFAEDMQAALSEARACAAELLEALASRPGPLSFVAVDRATRVSATTEKSGVWVMGLRERAALAHDLARVWSAAAALVPALTLAESATRPGKP